MQPCFQIPLLFESNIAAILRPTFVIKTFVCHRTCVCRFRVLCRIPSTDWKKPGGLTREKQYDATRRWKALTVGVAVTLTVPRTYVEINCSLALSFFSVARRVIYVEDKRGGFLAHTAATSADSSTRNDDEAKKRARELTGHIVRCMCRDCMSPGKQVHLSASWSRANGIACVFLHLKDLKDQVNDSSILRMMTRIDSWTDYSIWSDPSRLSYSGPPFHGSGVSCLRSTLIFFPTGKYTFMILRRFSVAIKVDFSCPRVLCRIYVGSNTYLVLIMRYYKVFLRIN